MGTNSSPAGTAHVKMLAAKALETEKGITVRVRSQGEAVRLRSLFFSMRFRDRSDARKIYPEGHHQHGLSAYDALETAIIRDTTGWAFVLQSSIAGLAQMEITNNDTGETITPEDLC